MLFLLTRFTVVTGKQTKSHYNVIFTKDSIVSRTTWQLPGMKLAFIHENQ
jgi:hypothetical protein